MTLFLASVSLSKKGSNDGEFAIISKISLSLLEYIMDSPNVLARTVK